MVGTSHLSTSSVVYRMKTSETGQNGPANLHVRTGRGVVVVGAPGRSQILISDTLQWPRQDGTSPRNFPIWCQLRTCTEPVYSSITGHGAYRRLGMGFGTLESKEESLRKGEEKAAERTGRGRETDKGIQRKQERSG